MSRAVTSCNKPCILRWFYQDYFALHWLCLQCLYRQTAIINLFTLFVFVFTIQYPQPGFAGRVSVDANITSQSLHIRLVQCPRHRRDGELRSKHEQVPIFHYLLQATPPRWEVHYFRKVSFSESALHTALVVITRGRSYKKPGLIPLPCLLIFPDTR